MESSDNIYDVSYSKKFQSFLVAGWARFLLARLFSLFYVIVFYRLVADNPEVLSKMIILSSGNIIISVALVLGLNYSAKQKTLESEKFAAEIFSTSSRFLIFFALPIAFFISIFYGLLIFVPDEAYTSGMDMFGFIIDALFEYQLELVLYAIFTSLSVLYVFVQSLEEALLNMTKAYALTAGYTILNSILVPIFYFIGRSLMIVIIAWNITMICALLIPSKELIKITFSKGCTFQQFKETLIFGLPSFLVVVIKAVGRQLDFILIFRLLDPLELPDFYVSTRFLAIGLEFTILFFSGLNPIFVRLQATNRERFNDVANSLFRMIPIALIFVFVLMTINSTIIGYVLVGSSYEIGGLLFLVLALFFIVRRSTDNFVSLLNTLGFPKKTLFGEIFRLSTHFILAIAFLPWGVLGIAIAMLLSESCSWVLMLIIFRRESRIPFRDYIETALYISLLLVLMIVNLFLPTTLEFMIAYNLFFLIISYIGFNVIKPLKSTEIQLLNQIAPKKIMKVFYQITTYSNNEINSVKRE